MEKLCSHIGSFPERKEYPLVPLYLVRETWCLLFNFFGWITSSPLVHLGYISYPFRCNVINVIKHL